MLKKIKKTILLSIVCSSLYLPNSWANCVTNGTAITNCFIPSGTTISDQITVTGTNLSVTNNGVVNVTTPGLAVTVSGWGFTLNGNVHVTDFINTGTITSSNLYSYEAVPVVYGSSITNFFNSGTISYNTAVSLYGPAFGYGISTIGTLTNIGNMGLIANDVSQFGGGTLTTLNNSQGSSSSALSYRGVLPTNYNIIINSTSNYGQLSILSPSGSMAFNIYGNTGTTLVGGVSASTVTTHRYLNVLGGLSSLTNITGTTGTYGGLSYSLVANLNTINSWDLLFGPSAADTQSSLQLSANSLKGVYALQTASITNGLTYDCNVFNKEGICVSAGGRYDRVNTGNTHATNGLLIGSYKVDANTRVGAWVDQNLSASSATGVNLNNGNPMFGVFGVWNADKSGNGFEARLSAGYGDKDLTVTRQVVGTSEAGTGKTRLNTQGASAIVSYNIPVATDLTASPYLGVRYTRVNANAYTEPSSTAVTAPLTYSALKQETTTALAGLKFSARMSPECGVFGSVGAELDTSNKGNNYSATGVTDLTDIALNRDVKRLRGVASAGTYYDIDKTQRLSLNAVYREEAFQRTNTLSTMATYTAGF